MRTLTELNAELQHSAAKKAPPAAQTARDEGDFREQRRWKRGNSSEDDRPDFAKKQGPILKAEKAVAALVVRTKNYFAPLRVTEVDASATTGEGTE